MEKLHTLREEIVTNLTREERPKSLRQELVNEVWRIDRELADQALFLAGQHEYQPPTVQAVHEPAPVYSQHETLF